MTIKSNHLVSQPILENATQSQIVDEAFRLKLFIFADSFSIRGGDSPKAFHLNCQMGESCGMCVLQ